MAPESQAENYEELERCGTSNAWSRECGIAQDTVAKRMKHVQGIIGKDFKGIIRTFYAASDIYQYCSDLLLKELDPNGDTVINGVICIGVNKYARANGLQHSSLQKAIREAGIPAIGKARGGNHAVDVYEKTRVEGLEYVKYRQQLNEAGEVVIEGKTYIGVEGYSKTNALTPKLLQDAINAAGILPFGKAWSGMKLTAIYDKSLVAALEYVIKHTRRLNTEGEVVIGGKVYIGVQSFASAHGITAESLQKAIDLAVIPPYGKAMSGNATVDVYEKSKVDEVEYVRRRSDIVALDEQGAVVINGLVCIGVTEKYVRKMRLTPASELKKAIEKSGIPILGRARNVKRIVNVYEKAAVEQLEYVRRRRRRLEERGVVIMDNGIEGVGVVKYASLNRISEETLQEAIDRDGIQCLGKARSGSRLVKIFEKAKVDALPCMVSATERSHYTLDERGIVTLRDGTVGVTVNKYAREIGAQNATLQKAIDSAQLPKIGRFLRGSHTVNVYEKTSVDRLPYVRDVMNKSTNTADESGIVILDNGTLGVCVCGFARAIGAPNTTLQKHIDKAGFPVIGRTRSGRRTVDVYEKKRVENLPYVRERIRDVLGSHDPHEE